MQDRNEAFQHLVLAGLWAIITNLYGRNTHPRLATNFQSGAIAFGDKYGQQTEAAQAYRREVTYGGNLS